MDGVRERYPESHGVLEFIGNPEFFGFCWRGVDAVGIEMGPRGTSALGTGSTPCAGWEGGQGVCRRTSTLIKGQVICEPAGED